MHEAGQCIREHGIPGYQDPVLTPEGQVYTDQRSLQDVSQTALQSAEQACRALVATAGFDPESEPPAPPKLVEAGVRAAQCMRSHGLPDYRDPTAQSPYTPGHGFGVTGSQIPSGGKANPVYQRAATACRQLLDQEIQASTLSSLAGG
jgi:hypothetical protein